MTFAQRAESDQAGDSELITAVRGGDRSAYGVLYERHREAAYRLARQFAKSPSESDDLVSEAFAKVFDALLAGKGPDTAFRAYLLTSVRNTFYDSARRDKKVNYTDDMDAHDPGVPFRDTAIEGLESSFAARAFARLPERWQAVLWHTEIEGESPATVAPLLGMTPNGVAALAYRAREGLRQAYLQQHLADTAGVGCQTTVERLGAWARGGLSKREKSQVDDHLATCDRCSALAAELVDLNSGLRGVVAVLVLGSATIPYLAAGTAAKAAIIAGAAAPVAAAGAATPTVLPPTNLIRSFGTKAASSPGPLIAAAVAVVAAVAVAVAFALTGQGGTNQPSAGGNVNNGVNTGNGAAGSSGGASASGSGGSAAGSSGSDASASSTGAEPSNEPSAGGQGDLLSQPTDPTNPTDPTQPTDPTNPTDPTQPTDPTNPTDPTAAAAIGLSGAAIEATISAGGTGTVEVTITNSGSATTGALSAELALPAGMALCGVSAGWTASASSCLAQNPIVNRAPRFGPVAPMAPSGTSSVSAVTKITMSGPSISAGGQRTLTLSVAADPQMTPGTSSLGLTIGWKEKGNPFSFVGSVPIVIDAPVARATISVTGAGSIEAGTSALVELIVANSGTAATSDTTASITLPAGVSACEAGGGWTIVAGVDCSGTSAESTTLTLNGPNISTRGSLIPLTLVVDPQLDAGTRAIGVTVGWTERANQFSWTGSVPVTVTPAIQGAVLDLSGQGSVAAAGNGSAALVVTNTGTASADNPTATLTVPAGVSVCSVTGWSTKQPLDCSRFSAGPTTVVLTHAAIPAGAKAVPLTLALAGASSLDPTQSATLAVKIDWTEKRNPFTFAGTLALAITPAVAKASLAISGSGSVVAGGIGKASYTLTNTGKASAEDVTIALNIPAGVIVCAVGGGWTAPITTPCVAGMGVGAPTTLTLSGPTLTAGASRTIALTLAAQSAAAASTTPIAVEFGWTEQGNSFDGSSTASLTVGAAPTPPGTGMTISGQVGADVVGNTLLTCDGKSVLGPAITCAAALKRSSGAQNDNFQMIRYLGSKSIENSASSATISAPPASAQIVSATVYWAAWEQFGGPKATARDLSVAQVNFGVTGSQQQIPAAVTNSRTSQLGTIYSADVTSMVTAAGEVTFSANVTAPTGRNAYAGWGLVIVYADSALPTQTVSVLDGANVTSATGPLSIATGSQGSVQVGVVAFEGDPGKNDTATLGSTTIKDPLRSKVDGAVEGPDQNGFGIDAQTALAQTTKPVKTLTFNRGDDGFSIGAVVVTSTPASA